jgi:hypothetical protein
VHWHLRSKLHFAVLTSDSTLSLFDVRSPAEAEQTFKLHMGRPSSIGIVPTASFGVVRAVDFAFGVGVGWDVLAVYLMTRCVEALATFSSFSAM